VILPTRTRSVERRDFANAKPRGVLARALTNARQLKSFRYGVSAIDPITFTACSPAGFLRRASLVNPMIALRAE